MGASAFRGNTDPGYRSMDGIIGSCSFPFQDQGCLHSNCRRSYPRNGHYDLHFIRYPLYHLHVLKKIKTIPHKDNNTPRALTSGAADIVLSCKSFLSAVLSKAFLLRHKHRRRKASYIINSVFLRLRIHRQDDSKDTA